MRDKIPGYIAATTKKLRDHAQTAVGRYVHQLDGAMTYRKYAATTHHAGDKVTLAVSMPVPGTKNDRTCVLYRVHYTPGLSSLLITSLAYVGYWHYLHEHCIAAVHVDGGAATSLCGYETPTTYRRIQQVARVAHRSHMRSAYIGKMPIDPDRVYIHPSGIPFQMPQYETPADWLFERALDKEFDHA